MTILARSDRREVTRLNLPGLPAPVEIASAIINHAAQRRQRTLKDPPTADEKAAEEGEGK